MKAFNFRLQTKLDISVLQEQTARERMQASISTRNNVAEALDNTVSRMNQMEQSVRDLSAKKSSFQELLLTRQYLPVLKEEKEQIKGKLVTAEKKVEEMRKILLGKKRETNTLEKLRQKSWDSYLHEVLAGEQKDIDEIAISTYYRKHNL
ncbi:MAG: flagellar export protein FliJ [Syntrophomonadaceae bacterium]|nr:flagellar export protein FliJ [Syntrophomonadaceae bacterium]MDD3888799.1 flagellar export protein FliJ [Syntrophomonadaceae bacterium]MDD4548226.1 flagellar export protein FliJ [Syntrophomonadaceae bacterium]